MNADARPRLLTVKEFAEAARCSTHTVYMLVRQAKTQYH